MTTTPAPRYYPDNLAQTTRLGGHPKVSATFALDRGLWDGRRVAVRCITRGNAHRRTTRRIYYGVLDLSAGDAQQIGVRHDDGSTSVIHRSRAVDVYDLTRER
jgi:hypothetical protein